MTTIQNPKGIIFVNSNIDIGEKDGKLIVPIYSKNKDISEAIYDFTNGSDGVFFSYQFDKSNERHLSRMLNVLDVAVTAVNASAPVYELYNNKLYSLKPIDYTTDERLITEYATPDEINNRLATIDDLPKYQSDTFHKLRLLTPVDKDGLHLTREHKEALTASKRGLEVSDLSEFFSWESNKIISPSLFETDFIGVPNIKLGQSSHAEKIIINGKTFDEPKMVQTTGFSGVAIPMKDANGYTPKYQMMTDVSKANCRLKATTSGGKTIKKSEYSIDQQTYQFDKNGKPETFKIARADNKNVLFLDDNGFFKTPFGSDVKDVLKERGYDIPELIDSLKSVPAAKYIWMSPGSMVGDNDMRKDISPSHAGFIPTGEDKGDGYNLLVVEGALKGHIVAKYATIDMGNGSLVEQFNNNRPTIVAQIPGVAQAFIDSLEPAFSTWDIKDVYLAFDADAAENKLVANGVHYAEEFVKNHGIEPNIMVWDASMKGLDDMLLGIYNSDKTLDDARIRFGTASELFPLNQASLPKPVTLGNKQVDMLWFKDYEASVKQRDDEIHQSWANVEYTL